jgi:hypothetical protein
MMLWHCCAALALQSESEALLNKRFLLYLGHGLRCTAFDRMIMLRLLLMAMPNQQHEKSKQ